MAALVRRLSPWRWSRLWSRRSSFRLSLTLADVAAVLAAGLIAGASPTPLLAGAAAAVLVTHAADQHRPRLVLSLVEDLPGLLVAAATAAVVVGVMGEASVTLAMLALAGLVLAHSLVYAGTRVLRRSGRLARRVLVVGTGATARRLATTLMARPELGLCPVGFVGTVDRSVLDQARGLPLAMLGPVDCLARAMTEAHVDAVVVALPGPAGEAETAALEGLLATPADVYAVPPWLPPVQSHVRHSHELIGGVPLAHLHRRGGWLPVRAAARLVEVLGVLMLLAALLPVALLLAALVAIETGGVLVRRSRVDENGRHEEVSRFRTHRARSVARPGTTFSIAISGRIGPVGRVLRRTHLDALPEQLTVLLRRLRYGGGVPARAPSGGAAASAAASGSDEAQVDAGQLTR